MGLNVKFPIPKNSAAGVLPARWQTYPENSAGTALKFKVLLLTFADQLLFAKKAAKGARRKPPSSEGAITSQVGLKK